MYAVQAEAITAFNRKDWVTLAALVRAFNEPQARLAGAWAELELGHLDEGFARIRHLFGSVSGPIELAPVVPWSLWNLRKRFGPTQLIEWGLHDALLEKLWLELGDLPVSESNAFAKEWVDGALLAFMTALPERVRPPLPWQLGGSAAVLGDEAWLDVLAWLRELARAAGVPKNSAYWVMEGAATASPSNVPGRARALGALGYEVGMLVSEARLRQLAGELDARLLLEDLRRRVPEAVRALAKEVSVVRGFTLVRYSTSFFTGCGPYSMRVHSMGPLNIGVRLIGRW